MKFFFKHIDLFFPASSCCIAILIMLGYVLTHPILGFDQNIVFQNPIQVSFAAEVKTTPSKTQVSAGLPVRLKIPSIRVNAKIRHVGLTKDGLMDVPKLPRDTAWYMLGPKPGEKGSAVIAGHVNWWNGVAGAFQSLKKLKPGDKITVQDEKGMEITFVVREIRSYDAGADARDIFISNDGKAHLNLITCDGIWNKRTQQYTKRLVVFSDKES